MSTGVCTHMAPLSSLSSCFKKVFTSVASLLCCTAGFRSLRCKGALIWNYGLWFVSRKSYYGHLEKSVCVCVCKPVLLGVENLRHLGLHVYSLFLAEMTSADTILSFFIKAFSHRYKVSWLLNLTRSSFLIVNFLFHRQWLHNIHHLWLTMNERFVTKKSI